jgi:hypothetical protein
MTIHETLLAQVLGVVTARARRGLLLYQFDATIERASVL